MKLAWGHGVIRVKCWTVLSCILVAAGVCPTTFAGCFDTDETLARKADELKPHLIEIRQAEPTADDDFCRFDAAHGSLERKEDHRPGGAIACRWNGRSPPKFA